MKSNQNKILIITIAVTIVLVIAALWYFSVPGSPVATINTGNDQPTSLPAGPLDAFARCLTQKGFTMYWLYSCPHCQAEKALFGDSFQYVNYVECSTNPDQCTAANVDEVPTWIEADGTRLVGTQTLAALAQASGCTLPQ